MEKDKRSVTELERKAAVNGADEGAQGGASGLEARNEPEACCRHKYRLPAEEQSLLNRLNRIEGQVRGIKNMVSTDRYCVDILTQVSAVQAALNSFSKVLLSSHIKGCVVEDIQDGKMETIDELCSTIQKLMK